MFKPPSAHKASEVLKIWNIHSKVTFVRGVENYVYVTDDKSKYLRLTTQDHRSYSEVSSELDWINDLKRQDVSVACPLISTNKLYAEAVRLDNQDLTAVIFEAAPGYAPTSERDFNDVLLLNWDDTQENFID